MAKRTNWSQRRYARKVSKDNDGAPLLLSEMRRKHSKPSWFKWCIENDPERWAEMQERGREKRLANAGRKASVPAGFTEEVVRETHIRAHEKAKEIFKKMVDNNVFDSEDEIVNLATQALIAVIVTNNSIPEDHPNRKLVTTDHVIKSASKLLDMYKQRPMAKSEVTLKSAEDLLAEILGEDAKES